jgi:cytochrome c-type biogenesis protein CcmH/NrfG
MSEMPKEQQFERGGNGPLIALLVAGAIMCAGSIGAAGFFLWRAAKNTADRQEEEKRQAEPPPDSRPK